MSEIFWKRKKSIEVSTGPPASEWHPRTDPFNGENTLEHYNTKLFGISYKDKTILDLGAWHGDSAEAFLYFGAKKIIAVEGSEKDYKILRDNCKKYFGEKVYPIYCLISRPQQIEDFIVECKPDILKSDIEGAEMHLYNIKDEIWSMVPEYLVECHTDVLITGMRQKCLKTNYYVIAEQPIAFYTMYAIDSRCSL